MTQQIKQKEETRKIFYVQCPECNKKIKGTNTSQVEYNLKLHLEKHKKEEKENGFNN